MNSIDNTSITRGKLLNRFFVTVWLIALMYNFGQNMLNNAITLYIDSLGGSTTVSGFIALPFAALAVVARFVAGYTTDHIGRRFTMLIGCLVFAVSVLGFGLVPSFALLFIMRAFHGFGYSAANTAAAAANIDTVPPTKITAASGLFYLTSAITIALSGSMTMIFSSGGKFLQLFIICTVILLIGSFLSWTCNYEKTYPVIQTKNSTSATTYKGLEKFFDRCALKPAIIIALVCIVCAVINAFILLFGSEYGIANPGIFFTLSAVVMLFFNLFSEQLTNKFGAMKLLIFCCGIFIIAIVGLAFTYNSIFYYFLGFSYGCLMGGSFPVLYALGLAPAAPERRGAASSLVLIATDLGIGIGSPIWGAVIESSSYRVCFLLNAAVLVVTIALSILFFREKKAG